MSVLQRRGIEIDLNYIFPNPDQPRKVFSENELMELTNSIKEYGVLQPIIVNKVKTNEYFLIAGERRFRAAKLAGLSKIPAIVRDFTKKDAAFIALIENVQRENLSFIEEAYAYKKIMDDFDLTQNEMSLRIGKNQSTISNKMRLLNLPKEIQEEIIENRLTERHARALLRIEDDKIRKKVLQRIIDNSLNVKQTETLINQIQSQDRGRKHKNNKIGYISYKIYTNTLRTAFKQVYEMEKNAKFMEEDKGEYIEVKITIPKKERCFT